MQANVLLTSLIVVWGILPQLVNPALADDLLRTRLAQEAEARVALQRRFKRPIRFWTHDENGNRSLLKLGERSSVVRYDLNRQLVGDEDLRLIGRFADLQELALVGDYSNEGLSHLAGLKSIQKLSLYSPMITDAGIRHFEGRDIKELCLAYLPLTDSSLKHIARMSQLQSLNVSNCHLMTDDGIKELRAAKKLELLWLPGTAVTDEGLHHVSQMQQLKVLGLTGPSITERGVRKLTALRKLRTLYIDGVPLSPSDVHELEAALPRTLFLGIPQ